MSTATSALVVRPPRVAAGRARVVPRAATQPLGRVMRGPKEQRRLIEDGTEVDDGVDEWSGEDAGTSPAAGGQAQRLIDSLGSLDDPLPKSWVSSRVGGRGNEGAYSHARSAASSRDQLLVLGQHLHQSDPYVVLFAGEAGRTAALASALGDALAWTVLCDADLREALGPTCLPPDPRLATRAVNQALAAQVRRQVACRSSVLVQGEMRGPWLYRRCLAVAQELGARVLVVDLREGPGAGAGDWVATEETLSPVESLDSIEDELDPDSYDAAVGELTGSRREIRGGVDKHWGWLLRLDAAHTGPLDCDDVCGFIADAMWDIDSWLGSMEPARRELA